MCLKALNLQIVPILEIILLVSIFDKHKNEFICVNLFHKCNQGFLQWTKNILDDRDKIGWNKTQINYTKIEKKKTNIQKDTADDQFTLNASFFSSANIMCAQARFSESIFSNEIIKMVQKSTTLAFYAMNTVIEPSATIISE